MDVPFCEVCGILGVSLSGMHPEDAGLVRWTIYRCGHMRTEIVLDEGQADEPDRLPATPGAVAQMHVLHRE